MQAAPEGFGPLSGWDEFPIHQSVAPIRFVDTTDPRSFERYWFTAQAKDAAFFLVLGMGFYPNLGIADAYALLVRRDRQVTIRAQRRLGEDRANMTVGPISIYPSRPFAEWTLALGANEQDFRCDLKWMDTKRASFRKMDLSRLPGVPKDIHLQHSWGGYETFGKVEGWIECAGERLEFSAENVVGSRDHHWGIREGVGGLALARKTGNFSHCGQWVEFKDWSLWGDQVLYNIGSEAKGPAFSEDIDHKIAFDPVTRHFKSACVTNRLSNGEIKTLHYTHTGVTAFLRCAGYSGPDGNGTPQGNHHHGQDVGGTVTSDVQDLSDAQTRMAIAGFEDQLCFVECDGETTVGIFECCNPAMYNMCAAGFPGFSFLE